MHIGYFWKLKVSFAIRLTTKNCIQEHILLKIYQEIHHRVSKFVRITFKHLVTIERQNRNSGSSRSRALVGLSRAFRASLASAVKSCSVRTLKCASTRRYFNPRLPSLVQRPRRKSRRHSSVHFTQERATPCSAGYLLFRFISNVYPISTGYWRSRLNSHEDPALFARVKGKWKYSAFASRRK